MNESLISNIEYLGQDVLALLQSISWFKRIVQQNYAEFDLDPKTRCSGFYQFLNIELLIFDFIGRCEKRIRQLHPFKL